MMKTISIAALVIGVLVALPAVATDDRGQNFTPRQMAHCVMHRVKDAPSESYKTAIKACKDQFDAAASNGKLTQTAMAVDSAEAAK
jgi:hypothetical protein